MKVLIVDDEQLARDRLARMIAGYDGYEVVGEAANGEEAVRLAHELTPDVVLMDLLMPVMDGIAATEAICKFYPNTKVIALSTFHDANLVEQMMKAGAISYLLKNVSVKELGNAIRAAYAGKSTLAPKAEKALMSTPAAAPSTPPNTNLTKRQKEVLALLVDGLSNIEIAERLTITLSTARYHVSAILAKLDVSNRTEAATIAIKHGLIEG